MWQLCVTSDGGYSQIAFVATLESHLFDAAENRFGIDRSAQKLVFSHS